MSTDSLLWNPQMRMVYKAMLPAAAGGLLVGGLGRAFSKMRDGSLAYGDTGTNLRLLTDRNAYLGSIGKTVDMPKKGKKKKDEDKEKTAFINLENLGAPLRTFFRGSARPTGRETLADIPASYALIPAAAGAGAIGGIGLMGSRLKNRAKNNLKKERDDARREFEEALIYEQEEAAKRRKKAEEQCDLVKAVDEFLTAADRLETLSKTAGWEKGLIGAGGILALLAGYHGFTNAYENRQRAITRREKERLVGSNHSYSDVLENLQARNVGDDGVRVRKAPTESEKDAAFFLSQ